MWEFLGGGGITDVAPEPGHLIGFQEPIKYTCAVFMQRPIYWQILGPDPQFQPYSILKGIVSGRRNREDWKSSSISQ